MRLGCAPDGGMAAALAAAVMNRNRVHWLWKNFDHAVGSAHIRPCAPDQRFCGTE